MIAVTVHASTARFLRVLGPRPWDSGTMESTPVGASHVRLTMDVATARRAVAQLQARGTYGTARTISRLIARRVHTMAAAYGSPEASTSC
jgi:hypothetical protein